MIAAPPPPTLESLPAGYRLRANLGTSTVLPDLDFETYSEAGFMWSPIKGRWVRLPGVSSSAKPGLFTVGAARYAEHPTTEVLSCYYDLKDGQGKRFWRPGLPPPADLFAHVMAGGLLEAHNSGFETWIWAKVCVAKYGWPVIAAEQWRCSMAKCRAYALPGALGDAGRVVGLSRPKDAEGQRLLDKFSVPRNPTKPDPRTRVLPVWPGEEAATLAAYRARGIDPATIKTKGWFEADQADTLALAAYNCRDIEAEAELSSLVPDLPPPELSYWQVDRRINVRGVQVDREGLRNCIAIVNQCLARYNAEIHALTGGAVPKASQLPKLAEWLRAQGVAVKHGKGAMDDDATAELLKALPPHPPGGLNLARRALEIRQAAGSASVKKVFAMDNQATAADRLHDLFVFNGARTGRPTGAGPQPTNLPSGGPEVWRCVGCGHFHGAHRQDCPWCGLPVQALRRDGKPNRVEEWNPEAVEDALRVIATRCLYTLEHYFGRALETIGGCLRGLYCAAPGHDLVSSDYSAIEAVVLAFLANEEWRKEVFRTHGKIYETSAARMYSVPFEEFDRVKKETGAHHPLRKKGKIAELGFGFQGWIGAAKQFGMPGTDEEIKADILAWRAASPAVEWFWGGQTWGKAEGIRINAEVNAGHAKRWADKWDQTPFYFGVEGAAIQACLNPGVEFPVVTLDGQNSGISYRLAGDVLHCTLRSGRRLHYHSPRLRPGDRGGYALSYWGHNTNPKNGPTGWICMDTWGGRLVENIVQATANDILRFASENLERAFYPLVLHVYDEIVSEIPQGWGALGIFEAIMATMPRWASDWPIKASGGWRGRRYRKG